MNILQNTLFPRENEFSPEGFESFLASSEFESIVSDSIQQAFNCVSQDDIEVKRVKSDVMNSKSFCYLRDQLLASGVVSENNVSMSASGNVKNCFVCGDYIFVLCKEGASQNDTSITDNINNQSCDKDIIQIKYLINSSWTELLAIRLVYALGGSVVYSHDIPLSTLSGVALTNRLIIDNVESAKVTLKPGIKKHVANE